MRFLSFTALQAAILAALTTAGIVALYFLKHRRRRFVISSTQLWKRVLDSRMENSLFEKLRRYLSILLAVATALLIAMSIGRPEMEWLTGESGLRVIVLDTSPTMQARRADGRTRWQHAVEIAQTLVDASPGSTRFRITDTAGQFDSPYTDNRPEIRRLIESMHPVVAAPRFPQIDADSADIQTRVTFITDGVSDVAVPAETESLSVFEAAPNVGITAFEIRSMPTAPLAYEAFLEVFNSGKESRQVDITVSGAGQQRIVKNVRIGGGQPYREALDLSQFDGGGIRAAVRTDGDAFSADDIAYAYLPVKRRTRTLLVTRGNRFLENALNLDRLVDLTVVDPGSFDGGRDFDALVFDRYAPADPPIRPALIVGTQSASWLPPSSGYVANPRFESWTEDHPVMQHVSLFDVSIQNAGRVVAGDNAVLAASGTNAALIVVSEHPRWIQLTFDLQASDFPYHAGFPIFLDNAIAWFGRERLALRQPPGVIEVPLKDAEVRTIDGQTLPVRSTASGTAFDAPDPGLYVASNDDVRQYIAVNFASQAFSNINHSGVDGGEERPKTALPFLRHELWFYMVCASLLLISAEWYTYHRRITL